jgi:DNA-binding winged helix-turn-helix (wHTH) protein
VELDGLEIDLAARVVRRDGDEVHLTPIEFKLLSVLIHNRGRLLTHNALLQQVWGAAYMDARQTLRAHIANLRRKIEVADGERLIHTDHGVGYRLTGVHPESARRGRPAEEVIDRGRGVGREFVPPARGARSTTRFSGRGLRVA